MLGSEEQSCCEGCWVHYGLEVMQLWDLAEQPLLALALYLRLGLELWRISWTGSCWSVDMDKDQGKKDTLRVSWDPQGQLDPAGTNWHLHLAPNSNSGPAGTLCHGAACVWVQDSQKPMGISWEVENLHV